MSDFSALIELAKKNKNRRISEKKETVYCMLNPDEVYSAIITDAEYIEEDSMIVLNLAIIKGSSCVKRAFTFKIYNGSSARYDDICETLGTSGNPSELIGKCIYMHIERNGDFQNLRVETEMDKNEFKELISDVNSKSNNTGKKRTGSKDTPYVKSFSEKNEEAEEEDEFGEQYLDDEEDE